MRYITDIYEMVTGQHYRGVMPYDKHPYRFTMDNGEVLSLYELLETKGVCGLNRKKRYAVVMSKLDVELWQMIKGAESFYGGMNFLDEKKFFVTLDHPITDFMHNIKLIDGGFLLMNGAYKILYYCDVDKFKRWYVKYRVMG